MSNFDFNEAVMAKSHEVPVLVDFWAPWCGPCKTLSPILDELEVESDGSWELVKINTEEHSELAVQFGIRSIPNVKLYVNGKVEAEFLGALPKSQIANWLSEHLPDERKKQLEMLLRLVKAGDKQAIGELEQFAMEHPEMPAARLALAQQIIWDNPTQAVELLRDIREGNRFFEEATDIRTLAEFMECKCDDSSTVAIKIMAAQEAMKANDPEAAIGFVIETVQLDKQFSNELPRRTAIALFHIWGNDHELTKKYRKRFDMALY